jgi:hypothetical protein
MKKRQLILNDYRTAEDGLFTLSACKITKAAQEQTFVKVPGRFAPLDLSTVLTDGQPYYGNAKLDAVLESSEGTRAERQERIERLKNLLDGQIAKIVHPDFPGRYMVGRVEVIPDFNGLAYCSVALSAVLEPWLYNNEETEAATSLPRYEPYENLLPYPYLYNHEHDYAGVSWTDNGDGTITLNGTATEWVYFYLSDVKYSAGKTYTLTGCPAGTGDWVIYDDVLINTDTPLRDSGSGHSVTIKNDIVGKMYIRVSAGATVNNLVFKPMLNEGDTPAPFKPAKNIWDEQWELGYINRETGENEPANNYIRSKNYITVSSRSYCINAVVYRMYYDANKTFLLTDNTGSFAFTPPATARYMRFYVSDYMSTYENNIMITPGKAAAPYVPYINAGGKNLLPYPYHYTTVETNGITFTDNGDGTITANGTAANTAFFVCTNNLSLPAGTYCVSDSMYMGSDAYIRAHMSRDVFTTDGSPVGVEIRVQSGATLNNVTFKPHIELGDRIKPLGKNILNLDSASFGKCERNGEAIKANIADDYYCALHINNLSEWLFSMKGKTFTFSVKDNRNTMLSVVIYGNRTNGSAYQEQTTNGNSVTITVAEDFTSFSTLELRFNRKSQTFTDTTSVFEELMLNEGPEPLPYEPFEGFEPWYPLGDERLTLTNGGKLAVVPVVEVEGEVTLTIGNTSRAMSTGSYLLPELYLTPGEHKVQCSGTGTAKITYREAVLAG